MDDYLVQCHRLTHFNPKYLVWYSIFLDVWNMPNKSAGMKGYREKMCATYTILF